jgi:hypothetical protein
MGEQTPPLAIYPAPKKKRPPKTGMSLSAQKALFLVAGLAVGGGMVLATLYFAGRPAEKIVYRSPAQNSPAKPNLNLTDPALNSTAAPPTADKGAESGAVKPGADMPPFNPFDGSLASSMPPREINGHITAGPAPSIPDHSVPPAGAPKPPEPTVPKGLLVMMRLEVGDPNAAVGSLRGLAAKFGGSAIQFDEVASKPEAEGAILFVPAAKADQAEKELARVGGVVVRDAWNGNSADRLDRVEKFAQDRLSDLRVQRQELLVKFFEDAPQVKHIDEDTERINKSIAGLRARKAGSDVAVFKIKFMG